MSSTGTFMYDELIEFDLNHDKFVGDPPPAPTRDYKITFERDWNDMFKDCHMPYVKDSQNPDHKAEEQDTGQYIHHWADIRPVADGGSVVHNPLFVVEDVAALSHAGSVRVGDGFGSSDELSKLKVFARTEAYNQWDSTGKRVSNSPNDTHDLGGSVNALYLTLADADATIPTLASGNNLNIMVLDDSAADMMKIKYYRYNDQNGDEHIIVEVLNTSGESVYKNWIKTVNFTLNSLHLYIELHPVSDNADGSVANGSLRIASFQSSNSYHMSTYAKCFSEDWDSAFRSNWATETCHDDSNVQRTFAETMRLRLDDLFLASKQGDEKVYVDANGDSVAALSLTKISKFLNPGNADGDDPDQFVGPLDFGSRVGTQPQMLSIFDRALNYGRFVDNAADDDNSSPYRQLNLHEDDAFGFTVKFHDNDNTDSANSITILLLFKQKTSGGG